jgi:hypothetical protein
MGILVGLALDDMCRFQDISEPSVCIWLANAKQRATH